MSKEKQGTLDFSVKQKEVSPKTLAKKTRKVAMSVDADEIFANTRKTMDYDKFSFFNGNREINPSHVMKLEASMQKNYLFTPITVNEKGEIIDGQHRFTAAQRLGLPIYYVVQDGYGLKEIHILNANQKNMNTNDFMIGYCNMGINDYVIYKEFREKYGFGHRSLLSMLSAGENNRDHDHQFKNGTFKVVDTNMATKFCECLTEIGTVYEGYKRRNFVSAIISLMKNKDYDHSEFMHKLSLQNTTLVDCVRSKDYIILIEKIYNFKRRKNDQVRFY